MAKTLSNYNPTVNIGGGITPAGGEFPVAESHDILVDADGKRLDTKLDELDAQIGGTGETSVATQLGQKVAKSDITTTAPASTNTDTQVPSTKSMYTALATKPTGTLSTAKPVSGSTDTQIPTSKAVYTGLAEKVDTANITTTAPASTNTDAQVPSTKSMYTALATKPTGTLSTAEPVSSSTDTQIPTAKAVYTGLNKKINTADIASTVAATGSTSATKVPSETAVREAIEAKTIPLESSVPAAGDSPSATAAPSVAATRTAIDAAIDDASQDFEDAAAALQTSYTTFTSAIDAKIGDPTDAADDAATAVWPRLKNAETDIDALSGQFLITDALTTTKMADNTRFYIYTGKEIHVVNATTDITDTTGNIIYKYIGATSGNYTQNNLYQYDTGTSAYVAVTAANALNITVEGSSTAGTIYRPNYWFYYDTNTWKQGSNVSSVTVDSTLSIAGAAADAKATGDAITELSNDILGASYKASEVWSTSENGILGAALWGSTGVPTEEASEANFNTLTNDYTNLKAQICENTTFKFKFESGKYNESDSGVKVASLVRIRNIDLIPTRELSFIKVPNEYSFQLHLYDENGTWMLYNSAWVTSAFRSDFSNAAYIGLTIRKNSTPNADITADIPTIYANTIFYNMIDENWHSTAPSIVLTDGKYNENNSGLRVASDARMMNVFLIPVKALASVELPSGFDAQVHYFDSRKNWITYDESWKTSIVCGDFADSVSYIGLTIRKTATPNADIRSEIITVQNGIKTKLIQSTTDMNLFEYVGTFESGKYNEVNSGSKVASLARIRNTVLIPLRYVQSINLPSGFDAQIHRFNAEKVWVGYDPNWKASFYVTQVAQDVKYIGLTIRKIAAPNADISADVQIVKNGTTFSTVLGNHLGINDIYADVVESLKQARRTKNTIKDNYLSRNKPLTLFHFSDIHQEQGNLRDIVNFATENSDLINDTICTGDIVGARFQNGMEWFDEVPGAENILLAIGNHDVMNATKGYDDSQTATLAEIYEQFIAPYYANWNLSSDPSSGVTYYYKDYSDSKVRLIVLDCMLDSVDASADAVQYAWFVDTLANAVTAEYYVVAANHCFPSGASFIPSNWTNADYQSSQTYLDARYPEAVDNFIGNGGHFVCWLEGHSHADYYMNYAGTHGTQMALSVDAASKVNAEGFTDVNRLEHDRSYNSANLVTVDTGAEVIKVIKFGALSNYKLIPRKTLTIGFDGSIIAQG